MKQLKLYLDGKRQPQRFEKYAKEKFQNLKPQEVKENMLNDGVLSNAVFIKRPSCVLYDFLFFARAQIISSRARARNTFARATRARSARARASARGHPSGFTATFFTRFKIMIFRIF